MAEGSLKAGDLVVCSVMDIRPMLVRLTYKGQPGVIRGSAASRVAVGDHVKVRITEANVGGRFEGTLLEI